MSTDGDAAAAQQLGLLCLGELGRRTDLSGRPQAAAAIQAALNAPAEDLKAAASIALGGLTCGNLSKYLPDLMQQVVGAGSSKQQYLLLQALNEVVSTISSSGADGGPLTLSPGQARPHSPLTPTADSSQPPASLATTLSQLTGQLRRRTADMLGPSIPAAATNQQPLA